MGTRTTTIQAISRASPLRFLRTSSRAAVLAGVLLTLGVSTLAARRGFPIEIKAFFGLGIFAALVAGFVFVPWRMVSGLIPLFIVLPALKVFVTPTIGALKDVISVAAVTASGIVLVQRRQARRPIHADRLITGLLASVLALYVANIGGLITGETGYGVAWFQAIRLFNEPLALFVVGLTLREPQRTLAAARKAVIATGVGVALIGLAQQAIGSYGLHKLGFAYGDQIRTIGSQLRSFGTLDDPFVYASYLLLALAVLLMSRQLRGYPTLLIAILAAGLMVSYVRTAAVVALAIIGLALARRGHGLLATLLVLLSIAAAFAVFAFASEQPTTRNVAINANTYMTLNGRTMLWRSRIGQPVDWAFGQGVGATGTAAQRARESLSGKVQVGASVKTSVNDSAYLTLISDIGFIGLVVYIALLSRILALGRRAALAGYEFGWVVIAIVVVILIDGLSRESFTAYPTPYIAMLVAGLASAEWLRRAPVRIGPRV